MEESGVRSRRALVERGLLTIGQAEACAGLSKSMLYDPMSNGELPFVEIGPRRRIPRSALLALAARHLVLQREQEAA